MAEANFMPVRDIPVLTIPDIGVEEHGISLRFRIANLHGVIDVEGRHGKWHCTGHAEALSGARLLEMAWLPGTPGNNKVSQTVIFGDGVAEPYRGNPKGRNLGHHIRIRRTSGHRFEVEIPATQEQTARLQVVSRQYYDRRQKECAQHQRDEAIRAVIQNTTPADVRDNIHSVLEAASGLADSYARFAGFRIDPVSERIFYQHIAILHGVIQTAKIERVPGEFTGNVVPFGRS